jgi:hypothetical protein
MRLLLAVAVLALLSCKDKGGGTSATDAVGKMSEFKTAMCACKDEACAKQVSDKMAAWGREQPTTNPAMSAEDQKQANDIGRELGDCLLKIMSARDTGSASAGSGSAIATSGAGSAIAASGSGSASGSASTLAPTPGALPKECDEYKAIVAKIQTCERMSKSARETLVKGYEEAATRWATLNEASRASLAEACRGGAEAVMAAGKTQCGW